MGKTNKKFTILTSAYNSSKFFDLWAESILAQTYRPLEVIFVDDRSKDDTLTRIYDSKNKFEENDINIKVLVNESRKYCGSSYKKAWENSSGSFFGVLDSDDALVDDAVEYIMDLYNKNPKIAWIYTQFNMFDKKMKFLKRGFCSAPKSGESMLSLGLKGQHTYSHWRTFSKRHPRLDKIWGVGLRSSVDKYMGYRLEELSSGMFVNRVCYNYRTGTPGAISRVEKAMQQWKKVKNDAVCRRKRYNLKPFKIASIKK
jgi:glycosyltransferase involved in cell wall biosynthesis